eukprot:Anaeramoba_flamelloidesa807978_25.p1 GENE.a807978_25~~a807978_25.p1  ORF type:complete len:214 (-),score=5.72 a807978_25:298-939(-)
MRLFFMVLMVLITTSQVYAHNVWLERDGQGPVRVYFGHYENGVVEKTGGRLDIIKAETVLPSGALVLRQRLQDHIALTVGSGGDVALEEATMPRKSRTKQEILRNVFMARCGNSQTIALLNLDLVPEIANGNTFKLLLEGEPLANTEITVYDPERAKQLYTTDAAGRVVIDTQTSGRYLLVTSSVLNRSGTVNDIPFDKTRYILSLSFVTERS